MHRNILVYAVIYCYVLFDPTIYCYTITLNVRFRLYTTKNFDIPLQAYDYLPVLHLFVLHDVENAVTCQKHPVT